MFDIEQIAAALGAHPAEGGIPGLWQLSGYPELTSGQLLDVARAKRIIPSQYRAMPIDLLATEHNNDR